MAEVLRIYGFGSYFQNTRTAKDVDILICHENVGDESVKLAIGCKQLMVASLPSVHITMLSTGEEEGLNFLHRSQAILLDVVSSVEMSRKVRELVARIVALDQWQ